jgi:chloramphenicol 3-O-phosphotransferase
VLSIDTIGTIGTIFHCQSDTAAVIVLNDRSQRGKTSIAFELQAL